MSCPLPCACLVLSFSQTWPETCSFSLGRQSLSTHWLLDCKGLSKSSNRTDCSASTSPSTFYRCKNRFAEKKATPVHSGYSQTLMYTSSSTPIRPKVEMITYCRMQNGGKGQKFREEGRQPQNAADNQCSGSSSALVGCLYSSSF